jgi:hypothetical protein
VQQKNLLFRKKVSHLLFQPKIAENGREKISGLFRQVVRLLPIYDFIEGIFVELNSDCGFFNKPSSSNHEARVVMGGQQTTGHHRALMDYELTTIVYIAAVAELKTIM